MSAKKLKFFFFLSSMSKNVSWFPHCGRCNDERSGRASARSHRVGHLAVDLSSRAGRGHVQVDVVLLVQAQVAVAHQVQGVDTPATRGTQVIGSSYRSGVWAQAVLYVSTRHINTRSLTPFSNMIKQNHCISTRKGSLSVY